MQETHSTNRELPAVLSPAGQGVVLACLLALFAFTGPFGTYDTLGPLGRVGYWSVALGVNWLVCASVNMLTLRAMARTPWRRRALAVAGANALAAVPGTAVVFTAETLFRPGYVDSQLLPTVYVSVVVVMLAISSLVLVVSRAREPASAPEDHELGAGAQRFLDRLPKHVGRDIVCLSMADHYVEVFTTEGSTLVLMRFSDALSELDAADGLRVHRSHWVSRGHVTGATRRNGRTLLRLTGGREVPVSRAYLADVRTAGLA
ncbi:MAG: LytTR family transcriptional regulator [Gammaproteobacteria bacterium]|nr:LytTR family transcriptional regulator [Gammaproteobacteria bacterium]MYE82013.1 LytTR family transcriptional regulator [Gammaproteobacteria bacterium]